MNRISLICCFVLLLLPALGQGQSANREVFVYLPYFHHHGNPQGDGEALLNQNHLSILFEEGAQEMTTELSEDQRWYRFEVPVERGGNTTEVELVFRSRETHVSLPSGKDPVFIFIREERLFPYGVEVLSSPEVASLLGPQRTEINGKLAILNRPGHEIPAEVELVMPFMIWGDVPQHYVASLEGDLDWKNAHFKFLIQNFGPTLLFVHLYDRYFPIVVEEHDSYDLSWEYKLIDTSSELREDGVLVESETIGLRMRSDERSGHYWAIGQRFFNEKYPDGLSETEYQTLVNTFMRDRADRIPILIDWSQTISERYENQHRDPDEFLRMINNLGDSSFPEVLEGAFDRLRDQQNYEAHWQQEEIANLFLIGLLLSLFVFVAAVVLKLRRSPLITDQRLQFAEWALHACIWGLIMVFGLIQNHHGYLVFSGLTGILRFLIPMAAIYVNLYVLVPGLLLKRKWGRYLLSVVLTGAVAIFLIALTTIPETVNALVWIDGEWNWISYLSNYEVNPPPEASLILTVMSGLFVPAYGWGRHALLNRMPQLTQKTEALNAELHTLKNQISPHFFFNSLNTVYSFALSEDSPKTAEAITRLSDLMRFALYHGDQDLVPLETELDYLADYIELQRLRMNPARHEVIFHVEGEPGPLQIAPLMLITLIENAFKHGISMSHDSFIHIDLMLLETGLILTVENSVHPGQLEKVVAGAVQTGGLGLVNTQQRLDLLYPGRYEWRIEEGADRYFTQLSLDL